MIKLLLVNLISWLTSDKTSLIAEFFNIFIEKMNESEESVSTSARHTADHILLRMKKYASNVLKSTTIGTKFNVNPLNPASMDVKFDLGKMFNDQSMTYQKMKLIN